MSDLSIFVRSADFSSLPVDLSIPAKYSLDAIGMYLYFNKRK